MQARAAFLPAFNKPFEIRTVTVPEPGTGEVLIRIRASGLCGTDIHIQQGKISTVRPPYIPGHEMAGEIAQVGEGVTGFQPGDHVAVHIDLICNTCRFCKSGCPNLCEKLVRIGFERDGSHQEYAVVPAENVLHVADHIPFEQAAIIPDAVACTYHSMLQANVGKGDRVCILGVGGLGFHAIQIAKHLGAEAYATSRKQVKLNLAKEFGADFAIDTGRLDLTQEICRITDGRMCDVVFDNIGIETSVQQSLDIVRPGGKVIIVGYEAPEFRANYQDIMKHEKEIIGIRGSTRQEMAAVIQLVEAGVIKPFVYQTFPLEEINEAIDQLKTGKSLGRTVLVM